VGGTTFIAIDLFVNAFRIDSDDDNRAARKTPAPA